MAGVTLVRGVDSSPWTVPAGVTEVSVFIQGGGGGGGGNWTGADGGSGGGGGASATKVFTVTPGGTVNWAIGAGGTAGAATADATAGTGGTTWFSSNDSSGCVAVGGVGGRAPSAGGVPYDGGAGGASASGFGTSKFNGGKGGAGRNSNTGRGGYGGMSGGSAAVGTAGESTWTTITPLTPVTDAAQGGTGGTDGTTDATVGAVGGGGGGGRGDASGVGKAGGDGRIIITYTIADATADAATVTTNLSLSTVGTADVDNHSYPILESSVPSAVATSQGNGGTLSVSLPSGTAADSLVLLFCRQGLFITSQTNISDPTASGWTLLHATSSGFTSQRITLLGRVMQSGDNMSSVTLTQNIINGDQANLRVTAIRLSSFYQSATWSDVIAANATALTNNAGAGNGTDDTHIDSASLAIPGGWGSDAVLWLAWGSAHGSEIGWVTGTPTGYSFVDGNATSTNYHQRISKKNGFTSPEDPSSYGISGTGQGGLGETVVIRYGTSGTNATGDAATVTANLSLIAGSTTVDVDAAAATVSVNASLIAGTATIDADAAGVTLTVNASLLAGTATADADAAAVTVSTALSLLAGTATADADAAGIVIGCDLSLIAGSASTSSDETAAGVTVNTDLSLLAGTVSADATVAAATVSTDLSLISGSATADVIAGAVTVETQASLLAGTANADATADAVTVAQDLSLIAGSAVADVTAEAVTVSATFALLAGTADVAGSVTADGVTVGADLSLIAGAASVINDALATGVTLDATLSLLAGTAAADATADAVTLTVVTELLAGSADTTGDATADGVLWVTATELLAGEATVEGVEPPVEPPAPPAEPTQAGAKLRVRKIIDTVAKPKGVVAANFIAVGSLRAVGDSERRMGEARPHGVGGHALLGVFTGHGQANALVTLRGIVTAKPQSGRLLAEGESVARARVDPTCDCVVNPTLRNAGQGVVGRLQVKGVRNPTDAELILLIATAVRNGPRTFR